MKNLTEIATKPAKTTPATPATPKTPEKAENNNKINQKGTETMKNLANLSTKTLGNVRKDAAHALASAEAEALALRAAEAEDAANVARLAAEDADARAEALRAEADALASAASDAAASALRARTPATRAAKAERAEDARRAAVRADVAASAAEAAARRAWAAYSAASAEAVRLADALASARDAVASNVARLIEGRDAVAVLREGTPEDAAAVAAEAAAKAARLAAEDVAAAVEAGDASRRAEAKDAAALAARLASEAVAARKAAKAAAASAPRLRLALGVNVSDARPGLALRDAHAYGDAVASRLAALGYNVGDVSAYLNPEAHALAAARAVARRTVANGLKRTPTPLYIRLDADARAGRWDADGLGDMVGEAVVVFASALPEARAASAEDAARRAAALDALAARLRKYGAGDGVASAASYNVAAYGVAALPASDVLPDGPALSDASEDAGTARRRAAAAHALADALALEDANARAEALTLAAYRAVNGYLADVRRGRFSTSPDAVNLDAVADVLPDARAEFGADVLGEFEARRRDIIRAALGEALPALTPSRKKALAALIRSGGNAHAAARRLGVSLRAVTLARDGVGRVFADAVAHVAPGSIEAEALAAYVEGVNASEAEDAAARLAARKARNASEARKAEAKGRASDVEAGEAEREADAAAYFSAALAEAVASLDDARRDVVRLALSGASQRETADALGKSRAAVRRASAFAASRIFDALGGADALGLDAADAAARGDVLALAEAVRAALA